MEQQFLFEVKDLAVKYPNGELALYNVNFDIESPTFMAIVGPNGSGKSTLLKTALGLIKPVRGQVKVLGYDSVRESKKIRKLVRYVPQRDRIGLSVPLKVKDIVLMSRLLKKPPPRFASSKDKEIARESLKRVNMADLWDRPFPELSGGQRQRVLVARALAGDGPILMLDDLSSEGVQALEGKHWGSLFCGPEGFLAGDQLHFPVQVMRHDRRQHVGLVSGERPCRHVVQVSLGLQFGKHAFLSCRKLHSLKDLLIGHRHGKALGLVESLERCMAVPRHTHRDAVGDGLAAAFRCGAELTNMEFLTSGN